MYHYSGRSSSCYPATKCLSVSRHPELAQRSRSVAIIQPCADFSDEPYREKSLMLYPSTGYSLEPRRRNKGNSQHIIVGGGEYRSWEPKVTSGYDIYRTERKVYKNYDVEYASPRRRFGDSEARPSMTRIYNNSPLPMSYGRDGSKSHDPVIHVRLHGSSRHSEDAAYRSATRKVDHFEKYPRFSAPSMTAGSYSWAVDHPRNERVISISTGNRHARFSKNFG